MVFIKLILKSIFKRKIVNLLIIIQLSITIILMINSITQINASSYQEGLIKDHLNQDMNTTMHLTIYNSEYSDDFQQKFTELENYIDTLPNVKAFGGFDILNSSFTELRTNQEFINLRKELTRGTFKEQWPEAIEILKLDNEITSLMNLRVAQGENFSDINFDPSQDHLVPLLAGSSYTDILHLGQIITDYNTGIQYKVIGFLDKNSLWFDEHNYIGNMLVPLDDKFVTLYTLEEKSSTADTLAKANAIFFLIDDASNADYVNYLIESKCSELKLRVDINSASEDLNRYKEETKNVAVYNMLFGILLGIFSCLGIIAVTLSSIVTRKKELGIRIMAGATNLYIHILIIGELFILMVTATVISLIAMFFYKMEQRDQRIYDGWVQNPMNDITPEIVGITLIIMLGICFLTAIIPVKTLRKLQPRELIGGND